MRRVTAPMTLAIVFATASVLGVMPSAQADEHRDECSNASLLGSFGFTSTGTLLAIPAPNAGPFAEIGRQTFDGTGGTDGAATLTVNGNLRKVSFVGTYVVNAECTGSMTLFVSPLGATVNLDFVIDDNWAELRAITTGNVTGNTETREYRKQFRGRGEGKE